LYNSTFEHSFVLQTLAMTDKEKQRFYSAVGENIKLARENAGFKQEAFGTMLGLSRASVVNIEKGRQHPSLHILWEIATKLNIQLTDLLGNINRPKRSHSELKQIEKQISELLKDESEQSKEKVAQFIKNNISINS